MYCCFVIHISFFRYIGNTGSYGGKYMTAIAQSVIKRNDGRWAATYKYNGKRTSVYGKTEEEAFQKRQVIIDSLNTKKNETGKQEQNVYSENDYSATKKNNSNSNVVFDKKDVNSEAHDTNIFDDSLNINENNLQKNILLGNWLIEWLDSYIKPSKKTLTYSSYRNYIYRHIVPCIGNVPLDSLTPKIFQDFFDGITCREGSAQINSKISPKTLEGIRYTLNAAIRQAQENGLIKENQVMYTNVSCVTKNKPITLSSEEQERLILTCKNDGNLTAFGIIMALSLGLHLGELLALQWSNIDLKNKKIIVENTLSRQSNYGNNANNKSALQFSKSRTAKIICLDDLIEESSIFDEIENYRDKQITLIGKSVNAVISSSTGEYIDPKNYYTLFKRITARSKLPQMKFDILRNTFALRYLEQGYDISFLKNVLGCSDSSKTLKGINCLYLNSNTN